MVRPARLNAVLRGYSAAPNLTGLNRDRWVEFLSGLERALGERAQASPAALADRGRLAEALLALEARAQHFARGSNALSEARRAQQAIADDRAAAAAQAFVAAARLRWAAEAGRLDPAQPLQLLAELARLRAGPYMPGEPGESLSPVASALAGFAIPNVKSLLGRSGLVEWIGDKPGHLLKRVEIQARAPRVAVISVFAAGPANDCLAGCSTRIEWTTDARILAIAIRGAEASLFLDHGTWIGHVFAIPFRLGEMTLASVEANGTRLAQPLATLGSDGSVVVRSLFDEWLANASSISEATRGFAGFAVSESVGAGVVSVQTTRESVGFELSRLAGVQVSIVPSDPDFEALAAMPGALWPAAALSYMGLNRSRMLYETTSRAGNLIRILGNPNDVERGPASVERFRREMGLAQLLGRNLARFGHSPPEDLERRGILQERVTALNGDFRARDEALGYGGPLALSGFLINQAREGRERWRAGDVRAIYDQAESFFLHHNAARKWHWATGDVLRPAVGYAVAQFLKSAPSAAEATDLRRSLPGANARTLLLLIAYAARASERWSEYASAFSGEAETLAARLREGALWSSNDIVYDAVTTKGIVAILGKSLPPFLRRQALDRALPKDLSSLAANVMELGGPEAFAELVAQLAPKIARFEEFKALASAALARTYADRPRIIAIVAARASLLSGLRPALTESEAQALLEKLGIAGRELADRMQEIRAGREELAWPVSGVWMATPGQQACSLFFRAMGAR
jgi:hypothetical protein